MINYWVTTIKLLYYFSDDFTPEKSVEERSNKADEPFTVDNQIKLRD